MENRQELIEEINTFFERNDISNYPTTDKSRIKLLNAIADRRKTDTVVLELQFIKHKNELTAEEMNNYLSNVHNLEIASLNANGYSYRLQDVVRCERKEKIKGKIRSLFRK